MTRLPPRPELSWRDDGTPVAVGHDDVYFSADDGLAETGTVFLKGCGLPEAWGGRTYFTVAELGFGTGLNIAALWQLWERDRPRPGAWLHIVSFEGYPLDRADAAQALGRWPELAAISEKLLSRWPIRAKGVQQAVWPDDGVSLTLHTGDIAETLPQSRFKADAWFLDGFSPARNGEMWGERLFPLIAEHSAPGARVGTFTVAGAVRRGLADAGFEVHKRPGHGRKRERLEAVLTKPRPAIADTYGLRSPSQSPETVAVIGAGIGGVSAAHALYQAGMAVTLYDTAAELGTGASGNRLALVMPRLDAADTPVARILIDAYLAALATYDGLPGVERCTVRQVPKDDAEAARFAKLTADPPLPSHMLEASGDKLLHHNALILRPAKLLLALADGVALSLGEPVNVDLSRRRVNGRAFDAIVIATGHRAADLPGLEWLGLAGRLGQVDWVSDEEPSPASAIASGHYALTSGTDRLTGATFEAAGDDGAAVSNAARQINLDALTGLSPEMAQAFSSSPITSRAGIRATTPDRLPLIGAVPDYDAAIDLFAPVRKGQSVNMDAPLLEGSYLLGGLGSRGFTFAPWGAHILLGQLTGSPAPTSVSGLEAVSPMRQILRGLKRGQI